MNGERVGVWSQPRVGAPSFQYDPPWVASEAGLPVLAVGQHEDLDLRHRALEAGASSWISYNAFFRRGPTRVSALLGGVPARPFGDPKALR